MATSLTEELHINCPDALAFDLMADVRNITQWNRGVSRSEMKSDQPIGAGSRFETVNRGQTMASTITRYERPQRLEYDVTSKAMDVHGQFEFHSTAGGTKLDMRFDASPKGIMKVLFPVLKPLIRRDLIRQHDRFRDFCETRASELQTAEQ
jgi:hypothetical protein